jgi:hypothetical protein
MIVEAIIASAIGRRVAGGGFQDVTGINTGDYPVRAFWGLMCCVGLVGHGLPWWSYPAMVLAVFLGCAVPIHFRQLGIGGTLNGRGPQSAWTDVSGLTLHGVGNMILPALLVWYLGGAWVWILLAGVTIAGWYEIGMRIGNGGTGRPGWPSVIGSGPPIGELCWGAGVGLAIALAFPF